MDILMPQLGETVAEGKITTWFKTIGDAIKPGDNLFEIETDKVSMEVPATSAGVLAEIRVPAGAVAPVGAVVAVVSDSGAAATSKPASSGTAAAMPKPVAPPAAAPYVPAAASAAGGSIAPAPRKIALEPFREVRTPARNYGPATLPGGTAVTPLARRLASEAGIDLGRLAASGRRIMARDVERAIANGTGRSRQGALRRRELRGNPPRLHAPYHRHAPDRGETDDPAFLSHHRCRHRAARGGSHGAQRGRSEVRRR
jgi:pyruvate/2-oxoglutarate dehydrogenase complex dihydrolipoamide acyltransferase (E2) component